MLRSIIVTLKRKKLFNFFLGLAVSAYGEIYIADGTNIRMVDKNGIIHTIIGDHYHKSHWKPFPCGRTVSLSQV